MNVREAALVDYVKQRGGLSSYAELIKAGFNKTLLIASLKANHIARQNRGLYRLSEGMASSHPDLVAVSIKVPRGVICLISALFFHEATNEIPKCVDVSIPQGSHANRVQYPPVRYYRINSSMWEAGIERHEIEGHTVKIYSLAKTVADCFKFRNRIGADVAREALKFAATEQRVSPREIMHYAKICRVDSIIKPLLETML